MCYHVLIVEDDEKICALLKKFLGNNGYIISTASHIKACEALIEYFIFDLIILDIMLPGESGMSFIKRFNKSENIPVLMLSARGHVEDRIYALEHGAQDYITKPFDPRELLIRIKNLITRNKNEKSRYITFGEFKFDKQNSNLFKKDKLVHLTSGEKELLNILTDNIGFVVSRYDLLKHFSNLNERSIDAQISRLRSKIEGDAKKPLYLQTARSKGYIFWTQ